MRTRFYFDRDNAPDRTLYSFAHGNIFSFDNGICLNGLAALCEATRDQALMHHLEAHPDLLSLITPAQLVEGSLALGDRLARARRQARRPRQRQRLRPLDLQPAHRREGTPLQGTALVADPRQFPCENRRGALRTLSVFAGQEARRRRATPL
jgi:hypothetical protein